MKIEIEKKTNENQLMADIKGIYPELTIQCEVDSLGKKNLVIPESFSLEVIQKIIYKHNVEQMQQKGSIMGSEIKNAVKAEAKNEVRAKDMGDAIVDFRSSMDAVKAAVESGLVSLEGKITNALASQLDGVKQRMDEVDKARAGSDERFQAWQKGFREDISSACDSTLKDIAGKVDERLKDQESRIAAMDNSVKKLDKKMDAIKEFMKEMFAEQAQASIAKK